MQRKAIFSLLTFWALFYLTLPAQDTHDYQVELYDQLHGSEKQTYFKEFAPMSVGAVYLQRPGEGEEELRWHFRTMKELGFTSTKQLLTTPDWTFEDAGLIALEEGIIPWWYGEAGWEPITPELLDKLGLDENMSIREAREHPKMREHQTNVLKERLLRMKKLKAEEGDYQPPKAKIPDTGGVGPELPEETKPIFVEWVKEQYGTIEKLNHAYNMHHVLLAPDNY